MDEPTVSPPITVAPADIQPRTGFPWKSVVLIVATIALTVGLAFVPANLIEQLGDYGYLGIFLVTLLSSATIVLPSPAVGLVLAAGGAATLNPTLIGLVAGLAAGIGEFTGYLAGIGGSEFARRTRFYIQIERYVQRWGMLTIFVLAFIPSPFFDFAGIAAGTMRMPFSRFLIACTLGKTLRFIGVAWLGQMLLG